MMKAMSDIKHIITMDKEEVMRISYTVTYEDKSVADTIAANMARTAIKTDPDAASTVTVKQ
eukprot:1365764-Ditylum_brightwellii.AAC.1